jgi:hypothetical protein
VHGKFLLPDRRPRSILGQNIHVTRQLSPLEAGWSDRVVNQCDVDPGDTTTVNESPQPARLGRRLQHETHQAHGGVDHPQAEDRRAADRPGQDRDRRLSRHQGDAAHLPPLAAAGRGDAGRGGPATDPAGERERPPQTASGRSGTGESHAQGSRRGKLLSPERRRRAVVVLQERYRAASAWPAGWWVNTAVPSAVASTSSTLRRPSSGDVDPGNRTKVNESPQPPSLAHGLHFTMKRTRHTAEQIIGMIKTAEPLIA